MYNNHATFDGFLTVIAGDEQQVLQNGLHFEGDSGIGVCETFLSGAGDGVLTGAAAGDVHYSRTLNVVTVMAASGLTINGSTHKIINATCEFVPTSANPTTTYTLTCHAALST